MVNIKIELFGDKDIRNMHKIVELMRTVDEKTLIDVFGVEMEVVNYTDHGFKEDKLRRVSSSTLSASIELESVKREYTKEELIKIARQKFYGIWPWISGGNVLSVTFGVTPDDEEFSFSTQISGEWGDWHGHSKVICSKEEYLNYDE